MTLDELCTIRDIASQLSSSHNHAWRFARSVLGDGIRIGNSRLYSRAAVTKAIAKQAAR